MVEWFRALDLISGGSWFKSSILLMDLLPVVPVVPGSQLVSHPSVGIVKSLCYILQYLVVYLQCPHLAQQCYSK